MSISSVNNSDWTTLLNQYAAYQNTNAATNTASTSTSNSDSLSGITSISTDGDTFQLSNITSSSQLSAAQIYSKMDTNGDGSVSAEEFAAARPSNVTEEMAANLYNSFDTDSSGSLTESEYETAMNNASSVDNRY
ncbi:Ca2+-binding EF-hand superfamily protein [Sporomusaceae bacterium BoRhaA]|uniref:EF-hand domain-containing protein n=1 Tax=Pelorhabdus rhamnosifermentans TaxID=2772457 RepID=UPI001C0609CA|nr:EF-hand domain-containing protein [Pelorhabdus rhamnosifermentans]MBU2702252.1 Ca2+-binding EF-hand superfamily protein [Pelorhabdus rhamnosifermentans]